MINEHPVDIWIKRWTENKNFYFVELVYYDCHNML